MRRVLLVAALAAGLMLVPGAVGGTAEVCCVDAGVTATYDTATDTLRVNWTLPGAKLCALYVFAGYTTAGGKVNTQAAGGVEGYVGCNQGQTSWTSSPDNAPGVDFTKDFYVQVVFNCARSNVAEPPPTASDCRGATQYFEQVFSTAVKVPVKSAPTGPTAVLTLKQGTATIVRADGTKGPLTAGSVLGPGDQIKTAASSVAHLTFSDGSEVVVGPSSTLELGEGPATQRTFLQNLGEIWYSVKKLAGRRFVVRCRCGSTGSVRATTFTYAVKGNTTRVRVYGGTVAVTSAGKTALVKKGFETVASKGKAPSTPKKFTPPTNPFWES